jgi:hypothetical protein
MINVSFNNTFMSNCFKLLFLTLLALTSTLGLRTELTIILNDVALATWIAIAWVSTFIVACAFYKTKQDVKLQHFINAEINRSLIGRASDHRTVAENMFENKLMPTKENS